MPTTHIFTVHVTVTRAEPLDESAHIKLRTSVVDLIEATIEGAHATIMTPNLVMNPGLPR